MFGQRYGLHSDSTLGILTVSTVLTSPFMSDAKRLNIKLDSEKHELFRRACMRNESTMTDQILAFIDRYIAENPAPKKPE